MNARGITELTLSFPLAALGASVGEVKEIYERLYLGIIESIKEDEITGLQIYPSRWPRKVLVTVRDRDIKERLIIEGLSIFDKHVELQDETSSVLKVTVRDAPIEWSRDFFIDIFEPYGKIVRIENEMIYAEGKKTTWTTGTRIIYMSPLSSHIPSKLDVQVKGHKVSLSVWYRGQALAGAPPGTKCSRCGSKQHYVGRCNVEQKCCFICQDPTHVQSRCPNNDGTKQSENVLVFLSQKSVFSNFNMDCPIEINGKKYLCNEQYIQSEKCDIFCDDENYDNIMRETVPKKMKEYGDNVKNYDNDTWMLKCPEVAAKCNRVKFSTHQHAKQALLKTGEKILGEGTKSKKWGIGLHISNSNALDTRQWVGENLMGDCLMQIRRELQVEDTVEEIDSLLNAAAAETTTVDTDSVVKVGNPTGEKPTSVDDPTVEKPASADDVFISDATGENPSQVAINDATGENPHSTGSTSSNDTSDVTNKSHDKGKDRKMSYKEKLSKYESSYVTGEKPKDCAILIGDSNIKGTNVARNVPFRVATTAIGGLRIEDVGKELKKVNVKKESVTVVALHVGSCNWKLHSKKDEVSKAEEVYDKYVDTLSKVSDEYPHSELVISSIPPRYSSSKLTENSEVNKEIKRTNEKLRELCLDNDNLMFIDNDESLTKNGNAIPEVFRFADFAGVHLNLKGVNELETNIRHGIQEAYGKHKLRNDWGIAT